MVRYYGYYSNKSRGVRKREKLIDTTESQSPSSANTVTTIVESDLARKKFRKNWARLIQKIYSVDPLLCTKCGGSMRIISFIYIFTLHIQPNRSYEWWEAVNHVSYNEYSDDSQNQCPYEDEYSQPEPCEY